LGWLLKAATQGDDQSQYHYARTLLEYRGEKVAPEAVKWFTQSAEQGNEDAQYQLGLILYEGKQAARDPVAGAQWVCLAADKKHREARHLLSELRLFLTADEMAEARKRADVYQPTKQTTAAPP